MNDDDDDEEGVGWPKKVRKQKEKGVGARDCNEEEIRR